MDHSWVEVRTHNRGRVLIDPTLGQLAAEMGARCRVPAMGVFHVGDAINLPWRIAHPPLVYGAILP